MKNSTLKFAVVLLWHTEIFFFPFECEYECEQEQTGVLIPGVNNHNDSPWQKLRNLKKKSQLFIEFTFIYLNNLKCIGSTNIHFHLQY